MFKLIKSIFKGLLMITGILSMTKCQKGQGKVMFNGKMVEDKNFIVLNKSFGIDSTKVFYKDYVLEKADAATFIALNEHYAKDKTQVYYCDEYRESQTYFTTKNKTINILNGADPNTIRIIDDDYAVDQKKAYFLGYAFNVKDVTTFSAVDRYFSKDKFNVYYNTQLVAGLDGESFELINYHYAKDKNSYYIYGFPNDVISLPLKITDTKLPLELLEYPFSKNTENVFYKNQKIKNINPKTAMVIGSGYIKDDQKVFQGLEVVNDANPLAFIIPEQSPAYNDSDYFALDDHAVYYHIHQLPNANPKTFVILGLEYGKDDKHVFFKNKMVNNVDVTSFKIYDHGHGDEDAEDKNGTFSKGLRIKK